MSDEVQAVKVERIVVRVGEQEVALTVEAARELHRVLGELVGAREPVVLREREYVPIYPPQPYVPCVPYVGGSADPIGPSWWTVTCDSGTACIAAGAGSQGVIR
jgi:hypothetical protein